MWILWRSLTYLQRFNKSWSFFIELLLRFYKYFIYLKQFFYEQLEILVIAKSYIYRLKLKKVLYIEQTILMFVINNFNLFHFTEHGRGRINIFLP